MSLKNKVNDLYKIITVLVEDQDPAALGGASGEYDSQVKKIINLIYEKKILIDSQVLLFIFVKDFPDCRIDNNKKLSLLAEKINLAIKNRI